MAKISNTEYKQISTTLGKETIFNGELNFKKSLKIDGFFEGDIKSKGFLYIEEGAEVKANINVRSIVIGGVVKGNVTAAEKVEMLSSGKVIGNIKTAKLRIADGVKFEGKCEMINDSDSIDIFSASVEKLKTTLQSV